MQSYQADFIQLAIQDKVLQFGEFTLKSGRKSPYFFNAGLFNTGASLHLLGQYYAKTILEQELEFDVLFGPAYKGIPLVSSIAIALNQLTGRPIPFCFDRKEIKKHGEGGQLIGAPLEGKILIVDDVITAGTAITHSINLIKSVGAAVSGIVVAIDREEKGQSDLSAIQEISKQNNVPVKAIVNFSQLIDYIKQHSPDADVLSSLQVYRSQYGI